MRSPVAGVPSPRAASPSPMVLLLAADGAVPRAALRAVSPVTVLGGARPRRTAGERCCRPSGLDLGYCSLARGLSLTLLGAGVSQLTHVTQLAREPLQPGLLGAVVWLSTPADAADERLTEALRSLPAERVVVALVPGATVEAGPDVVVTDPHDQAGVLALLRAAAGELPVVPTAAVPTVAVPAAAGTRAVTAGA